MVTYFIVIAIVLFFSYMAQGNYNFSLATGEEVSIRKNKDIKIFLFIIVATLTITAGCRYYVGTDYANYIGLYNNDYSKMEWVDFLNFDEPIFPLMGKLSYVLFDSYFPMFFAASVITIGLMTYSTLRETRDFIFVSLLYIFTGGWVGSFNGVRQYIAVAIVFLGRKYIMERKFWRFLLVCGLAFLVHKSALFFVLIYFVYSEEFSTVRLLIITVVAVIVSRSYEALFDIIGWIKDVEFVPNDYALRSVNVLRILAHCAPAVLAVYYAFSNKLKKEQVFYAYMLIANAVTWVATADSAYLARLALYTGVFIPLALSSILESADARNKNALKVVISVLYAAFCFYEIIITDNLRNFQWIFGNLN